VEIAGLSLGINRQTGGFAAGGGPPGPPPPPSFLADDAFFWFRATDVGLAGQPDSKLRLPGGTGNYASSPDSDALDITGDIDIQLRLALDDWTNGVQALIAKYNSPSQHSWFLRIGATGILRFATSPTGSTPDVVIEASTAVGFTDGTLQWLRVTVDVDNDAGDSDYTFYTGGTGATPSWVQLGTVQNGGGVTSLWPGVSTLTIGEYNDLFTATGDVHRAIIKNGINGTTVFDADFEDPAVGASSFTESANGATVTMNGSSALRLHKILDQSGNQYDFTVKNGANIVAEAGQVPRHIAFDGVNDYAFRADGDADFELNNENFVVLTAFEWLSTDQPVSYDYIIGKQNVGFLGNGWWVGNFIGTFREYRMFTHDGTWRFVQGNSLAANLVNLPVFGFAYNDDTGNVLNAIQDGSKADTPTVSCLNCSNAIHITIGAEGDLSQYTPMKLYGIALAKVAVPTLDTALTSHQYLMGSTLGEAPTTADYDWDPRTGNGKQGVFDLWTDRVGGKLLDGNPAQEPVWDEYEVPNGNGRPGPNFNDSIMALTDASFAAKGESAFTFMCSITTDTVVIGRTIFRLYDADGPDLVWFWINGSGQWEVRAKGADADTAGAHSAGPANNTDYVLAVTWDAGTGAYAIRVNGSEVKSGTLAPGAISDLDTFWLTGQQWSYGHVRWWDSALTGAALTDEEQILLDYQRK
jgi:hypothetical protein